MLICPANELISKFKSMFIDTHAHLYLSQFDTDRSEMMIRARANQVDKMLLPNIDISTLPKMLQLVDEYPGVCYPMLGLHPCSVNEKYQRELSQLYDQIDHYEFVAIGEAGLDFYWDKSFISQQEKALLLQAEWAMEKKLPLVLHTREAIDRTTDLIRPLAKMGLRGVFHCFTGSVKQADQILEMGFYLGIGGVVTYKNTNLREVLKEIGLERIVLETDSPYLAPVPKRGKRNESGYLPYIAGIIADELHCDIDEVASITSLNAKKVFNIHKD